jgi:glycosyltransferase involved in cell wall biosynthesis
VDLAPLSAKTSTIRMAWLYDMNSCRNPTGVTRHALGQLDRLGERADVDLTVVAGRISEPDGLAYWERLDGLRRKELPISTRDALRFWRVAGWPPMEWRTGPLDWVYCPSEMFVPTRKAKLAVTSHDVLQDVRLGGPRRQALLDRIFDRADLVLSVSKFNTSQLLEMYPVCRGKVAYVPNAAEEIFFGEAATRERAAVRPDFGLPPGMPYLISVASFQARKNLVRLVKAAGRLREVENGELALVLLGAGAESEAEPIRRAIEGLGRKAVVKLPGYRQGRELLAAYAEATALVFPSTCESFGIPAVEAMAQRIPVALANSTALPEIGGEAGWYFKPTDEQAIATTLREMLDNHEERDRRVQIGRALAEQYRWQAANDLLVEALRNRF